MPCFKLGEVAQRLGVKAYWLQARLVAPIGEAGRRASNFITMLA